MISARTAAVAVAVSAMIGTEGATARRKGPISRKHLRNSWPHSLTMCASSTAMARSSFLPCSDARISPGTLLFAGLRV